MKTVYFVVVTKDELQVLDEKKITESTDFSKDFETPEGASKVIIDDSMSLMGYTDCD